MNRMLGPKTESRALIKRYIIRNEATHFERGHDQCACDFENRFSTTTPDTIKV